MAQVLLEGTLVVNTEGGLDGLPGRVLSGAHISRKMCEYIRVCETRCAHCAPITVPLTHSRSLLSLCFLMCHLLGRSLCIPFIASSPPEPGKHCPRLPFTSPALSRLVV